jgi:hypothetical protein
MLSPANCAKTIAPVIEPTSMTATRVFIDGMLLPHDGFDNWDLKHENNAIYVYEEKQGNSGAPELHYAVSDLGASFRN